MNDAEQLKSAAVHEAGHCIAAIHFGLSPVGISIVPDADSLGSTEAPNPLAGIEDEKSAEYQRACMQGIVISLAGAAAQLAVSTRAEIFSNVDDDLLDAEAYAMAFANGRFNQEVVQPIIDAGWMRARKLVHRRRHAVARVAEALLERGTLSGAEVVQLAGKRRA